MESPKRADHPKLSRIPSAAPAATAKALGHTGTCDSPKATLKPLTLQSLGTGDNLDMSSRISTTPRSRIPGAGASRLPSARTSVAPIPTPTGTEARRLLTSPLPTLKTPAATAPISDYNAKSHTPDIFASIMDGPFELLDGLNADDELLLMLAPSPYDESFYSQRPAQAASSAAFRSPVQRHVSSQNQDADLQNLLPFEPPLIDLDAEDAESLLLLPNVDIDGEPTSAAAADASPTKSLGRLLMPMSPERTSRARPAMQQSPSSLGPTSLVASRSMSLEQMLGQGDDNQSYSLLDDISIDELLGMPPPPDLPANLPLIRVPMNVASHSPTATSHTASSCGSAGGSSSKSSSKQASSGGYSKAGSSSGGGGSPAMHWLDAMQLHLQRTERHSPRCSLDRPPLPPTPHRCHERTSNSEAAGYTGSCGRPALLHAGPSGALSVDVSGLPDLADLIVEGSDEEYFLATCGATRALAALVEAGAQLPDEAGDAEQPPRSAATIGALPDLDSMEYALRREAAAAAVAVGSAGALGLPPAPPIMVNGYAEEEMLPEQIAAKLDALTALLREAEEQLAGAALPAVVEAQAPESVAEPKPAVVLAQEAVAAEEAVAEPPQDISPTPVREALQHAEALEAAPEAMPVVMQARVVFADVPAAGDAGAYEPVPVLRETLATPDPSQDEVAVAVQAMMQAAEAQAAWEALWAELAAAEEAAQAAAHMAEADTAEHEIAAQSAGSGSTMYFSATGGGSDYATPASGSSHYVSATASAVDAAPIATAVAVVLPDVAVRRSSDGSGCSSDASSQYTSPCASLSPSSRSLLLLLGGGRRELSLTPVSSFERLPSADSVESSKELEELAAFNGFEGQACDLSSRSRVERAADLLWASAERGLVCVGDGMCDGTEQQQDQGEEAVLVEAPTFCSGEQAAAASAAEEHQQGSRQVEANISVSGWLQFGCEALAC